MKRSSFLTIIVAAVLAVIFQFFSGASSARTPENYPLVCRGGGSLVIGIAPGERNIGFTFTRGTKPAREGLAPGECSWVDRGMHPNEPDRVSQHVEEGSESLKVGGKLAPENRWYDELHSADKYWTFMVSNNGRGQLIATGARPNAEMSVSPRARVPAEIVPTPTPTPGMPTPRRPDLPRARTLDDETPRMIVLKGPTGPTSTTEVMKGLAGGRSINIPPAPRALSMEEKVEMLKTAGVTFKELPNSYVTLTPQHPQLDGRGSLEFVYLTSVSSGKSNSAMFFPNPSNNGWVSVIINFETKGIYLMTFTVSSETEFPVHTSAAEFVFTTGPYYAPVGTTQTFLGTKGAQRLNIVVEVPEPGEYEFNLEDKGQNLWFFYSCELTKFKK